MHEVILTKWFVDLIAVDQKQIQPLVQLYSTLDKPLSSLTFSFLLIAIDTHRIYIIATISF